jgi:serine/threonine protein kinase
MHMAPETWGSKAGPRSDLYSLAFTYAELRTGKRPLAGEDFVAIMAGHGQREPDLGGLDVAERVVVRKALAKDPEQRQRTCLEFAAELHGALMGPAAGYTSAADSDLPRPRRRVMEPEDESS